MPNSRTTRHVLSLLVVLAILGGFAWKLWEVSLRQTRDAEWVTHSSEVLGTCEAIKSTMADLESSVRGYVLTGDTLALAPYNGYLERCRNLLSLLRGMAKDEPEDVRYVDTLQSFVEGKIARSDMILRTFAGGGKQAAIDSLQRPRQTTWMGKIRATVARMELLERETLQARRASAAQSTEEEQVLMMIAVIGMALFASLLTWSIDRNARILERSKFALEEEVLERTESLHRISELYGMRSEIGEIIVKAKSRTGLFESVCRTIVERGRFRLAWIGLLEGAEEVLTPVAWSGSDGCRPPIASIRRSELVGKLALIGHALDTGTTTTLDGASVPERDGICCTTASDKPGHCSIGFVPFKIGGAVAGVLGLCTSRRESFTDLREREMLRSISSIMSYALDDMIKEEKQHQAEQALVLLEKAVEQSGEIVFLTDPAGIITYVNPKFTTVYGYDEADVVGKVTPRILKSGVLSTRDYETLWNSLLKKEVVQAEIVNRKKDGNLIDIETSVSPVLDEGGKITGFLAVQRDITERKRIADLVSRNEQQLRQIIDLVPHFIFAKDVDGRFLLINKAVADAYGTTVENLTGKCDADFAQSEEEVRHFRNDDLDVVKNQHVKVIPEETITDSTGRVRNLATIKTPFTFVSNGRQGILGVSVDITDRKAAAEALKKSEQQFRLISENVADMIAVTDLSGKILYASPSYRPFLGDPELLRGAIAFNFVHQDDRSRVQKIFQEAVANGESRQAEYRLLCSNGEIRHLDARGSVVKTGDGKGAQVIIVSRDMTEKRELEKQLLRSQRIESIGTLAGGIAHDMNNILAPILMALELLRRKMNDPNDRKIVDMLESNGRRGADLVKQVLTFARGSESERVVLQVRHLIEDVRKFARETFPAGIAVVVDVPKNLWPILGDATQIHQVLLNLCVNARDAMAKGGVLTITAENMVVDAQYAKMHIEAKEGQYVALRVNDTGVGMPPEVMDKIFEPFFTTKESGKGTGLGLSTAYSIVRSHGGFITVYSEPRKGTLFQVFLPAAESASAAEQLGEAKVIPAGKGEMVLIVDDEEAVLEISRASLEANGYRVLAAADGTEAISLYVQHTNEVALVVTDMNMPHLDGPSLIRALHRITPGLKIVGISGMADKRRLAEAREMGMATFLMKPFTAETLLGAIRLVLDEPAGKQS